MATKALHTLPSEQAARGPAPLTGRGLAVALLLAAILAWLGSYWVLAAEIKVLLAAITSAVPAIPGLAALLLLLLLWPLLRRIPVLRRMSPAQVVVVYVFVTLATFEVGRASSQELMSMLTVPHYHTTAATPLHTLVEAMPAWATPSSPLVHRWFFEGSPTGLTPWGPWIVPIAVWTGFFVVFSGTVLCMVLLMADRWIDHERLSFPLVRLPLEMMGRGTCGAFFRNPVTWVGFSAAVLLNGIGLLRGVFFGQEMHLTVSFTEALVGHPWEALRPLHVSFRPEVFGFGYLLSTEVAFSVWFFWVLSKVQAVLLSTFGIRLSGAPFPWEQCMGAYLMLSLIVLWRERASLGRALRAWLVPGQPMRKGDLMRQWALLGALAGTTVMIIFAVHAGVDWWVMTAYLLAVLLVCLAYARIRAEAGVPAFYAVPSEQPNTILTNFLGHGPLLASRAGLHSMAALRLFWVLGRGSKFHLSAYHLEGLRLGRLTGVSWQQISSTVLSAAALGLFAGFLLPLRHFYDKGAGDSTGGMNLMAFRRYAQVLDASARPAPPNLPRLVATLFGGGLMGALVVIRSFFPAFPLNPIGYVVLGGYGDWYWFSFLLIWLFKGSILRYGGGRLYLHLLPAFLGFALGHYTVAGVIWPGLATLFGGPFLRYEIRLF